MALLDNPTEQRVVETRVVRTVHAEWERSGGGPKQAKIDLSGGRITPALAADRRAACQRTVWASLDEHDLARNDAGVRVWLLNLPPPAR